MNKSAILCLEFLSKRFRPGPSSDKDNEMDMKMVQQFKNPPGRSRAAKCAAIYACFPIKITFSFCREIITLLSLPELRNSYIIMFSHLNNINKLTGDEVKAILNQHNHKLSIKIYSEKLKCTSLEYITQNIANYSLQGQRQILFR